MPRRDREAPVPILERRQASRDRPLCGLLQIDVERGVDLEALRAELAAVRFGQLRLDEVHEVRRDDLLRSAHARHERGCDRRLHLGPADLFLLQHLRQHEIAPVA